MNIASLFLIERANAWFHKKGEGDHSWAEFEKELCVRFREEELEDVKEFMRIRQESIDEYLDKFEDVRIRMERVMPTLEETYMLSVFILED